MLSLLGRDRLAYLHLWPHVRPWRFSRVQPMLRGLPQVRETGRILGDALAAAVAERRAVERAVSNREDQPKVDGIKDVSVRPPEPVPAAVAVAAAE